jgi:hypothetical protein
MGRDLLVALLVALAMAGMALVGCGGSIQANGPDGSTQPGACGSLSECACYQASDRCTLRTESCWCPSVCDSKIACVCGGGRFLGCEDKAATSCATELAAVQAKCAGQPFVQYIGDLCTLPPTQMAAPSPACVAGCLANLANGGSCSEIDCSFCPVCDCAGPAAPSPFVTCLAACNQPQPEL